MQRQKTTSELKRRMIATEAFHLARRLLDLAELIEDFEEKPGSGTEISSQVRLASNVLRAVSSTYTEPGDPAF